MTGQETLKLIDRLLQANQQKSLNDLQSEILLAVCEGQSYQVLADRLNYEVDYVKQIAARLWKQIARIVGEDVSKRNIQSVLRRYQQTHEVSVKSKIQDWENAIDISHFYDRQINLQTLEIWILIILLLKN
jgi:DNA-binding CsgD family transcriptional regulator